MYTGQVKVSYCVLPESCTMLEGGCPRGIMGTNYIKDCFGFDGVFVIDLVIYSCFPVYMEFLDCVHKATYARCVEYFHDFMNRTHGVADVQYVGCETGFSYVVFIVMKVFFVSFLE